MPLENLEEEGLEKNPNLQLAQWRFMLTTDRYKGDVSTKESILEAIKADGNF